MESARSAQAPGPADGGLEEDAGMEAYDAIGEAGRVILATVAGDIHDIGKNIFNTLLITSGFEVIDLGIDVSANDIVKAVKEYKPNILGMSALLTTNLEQIPLVIQLLQEEGIRDRVKVIVGGATVTEGYAREARVDAYAKTAVEGVNICKAWSEEIRKKG